MTSFSSGLMQPNVLFAIDDRRWRLDERFGLSLHWALHPIPAQGESVRSVERLSVQLE